MNLNQVNNLSAYNINKLTNVKIVGTNNRINHIPVPGHRGGDCFPHLRRHEKPLCPKNSQSKVILKL